MKRNRLSYFRSCFALFFALILILVLCVPAAAYPPSFSEYQHRFTPFHMAFTGTVSEYVEWDNIYLEHPFEVPLPNIDYQFPGERSFSSDAHLMLDSDVTLNVNQYFEANYSTPDSFASHIDFRFELSTWGSNITSFYRDYGVLFQNGYLADDYSLLTTGDTIIFASYGDSYSQVDEGEVTGQFYVGNNPFDTFETDYDQGAFLSYYAVLYYSDYNFLDNLPENINVDTWRQVYDSLSDADFYHLTPSQIDDLEFLFSWVGPIFGRFGVYLHTTDTNFDFLYLLTDHVDVERSYEKVIQETIDSGKNGFERMTHWLGTAVSGFLSIEIMPNFSLGGLVVIVITFSLVLWWLKVFAGG